VEHPAEVQAEAARDVLHLDLEARIWVRSSGDCWSATSSETLVSTNSASVDKSRVDRWENRRRITTACRFTFSRAAIMASSPLETTTSS
jgi:hypothetical protein